MMKPISIVVVAALIMLNGCKQVESEKEINITGWVKNLPTGKIYLTHAHDYTEVVDSAIVKNGSFKFKVKLNSSFVPFAASLHFPDKSGYYQIKQLVYFNPYQSTDKIKSATSAFFLSRENVFIRGNLDSLANIRIVAGKENELYQKFINKGFGFSGNSDSTKRLAIIKGFQKLIKQYPFSYYFFTEIYHNKEAYTEKELRYFLSHFNEEVQSSRLGVEFEHYLTNRPDPNKPYANLLLMNSKNEKHNILHPKARLNLVVFWASWCGPCRQEIPALKEVNNLFKDKGLNMVSISVDEDPNKWESALNKERMDWQQFLVAKGQITRVKQMFNFSAIPFIILTDNSGMEIMKLTGYSENNVIKINSAITKYLAHK